MRGAGCPTCLYSRRSSGALELVGVQSKRVDDHHAKRYDNHRQYRSRRDDKQPSDGAKTGEEVAHRPAKSSSTQEVYARIERDERDNQVEDAPENEVRIHQVTRGSGPPAGPRERQERAQNLEARDHEHYDGGEGDHTRPSRYRHARTRHGIACPSRHRFTMLRHCLSFLSRLPLPPSSSPSWRAWSPPPPPARLSPLPPLSRRPRYHQASLRPP